MTRAAMAASKNHISKAGGNRKKRKKRRKKTQQDQTPHAQGQSRPHNPSYYEDYFQQAKGPHAVEMKKEEEMPKEQKKTGRQIYTTIPCGRMIQLGGFSVRVPLESRIEFVNELNLKAGITPDKWWASFHDHNGKLVREATLEYNDLATCDHCLKAHDYGRDLYFDKSEWARISMTVIKEEMMTCTTTTSAAILGSLWLHMSKLQLRA